MGVPSRRGRSRGGLSTSLGIGSTERNEVTGKSRKRKELPECRTITLPDETYQPRKAEHEKEYDMPGTSPKTIRRAFLRPFKVKRESAKLAREYD